MLKNERLYYKYKVGNKIIEKKIPYIYERNILFYDAHINEIHMPFKKAKLNILKSDYYYEGITQDLKIYIDNCNKCNATKNLRPINLPEKAIIKNGPRDEYQMDLWYLPKEIVNITNYKYVIDIIDVFSKWAWSYPVYDKTGASALRCFKKFVYSFGKPNFLHTDNGVEFKNTLIDNFCNKLNITHIFSKPYSPKSAGCVEATHKQIKKFVYDEFYTNIAEEFFLEDTLLTIINYHNNTEHSSTKYKPADIKDTHDPDLIKKVDENISKTLNYAIKYKNIYLLEEGEYLLVNNNIKSKKVNKNNIYEIFKKKKKLSGEFIIPAVFVSYTKDYRLKINISKDYKNIVKKDRIYVIDSDMCRLVSEKGYNYFFN